ncbi:MAG: MaoC family dehydratase N-terminal domain-containing protein [Deltaproteobacteria bacterium]|nr:MaoC family dehydratase N-terminal domain-containing protein [Deltaproteobacteria bacterium]
MTKEIYFDDINVGDAIPVLVKDPVDKVQLVRYAGASGDFNPLHTDPEIGKAAGIGGQIAHGMLIMGFVGQAITDWVPKKYLKKFSVRFAGMTRPGDIVTVTGSVREKKEDGDMKVVLCDVVAKNQKDEVLISGFFEAMLPVKQ